MYIVSYDITNDKRRRKIAKILENYGKRVQYSVFECNLDKAQYNQMYQELCNLMVLQESEADSDELERIPFLKSIDHPDDSTDTAAAFREISNSQEENSRSPVRREKGKKKQEEGSIRIYSVCRNCMQKTVQIGVQQPDAVQNAYAEHTGQADIIVIG